MTSKMLTDVLERAKAWPPEDQEALVDYARDIEAQRSGVYMLSKDEHAAVEEGLAQANRGEYVSDEEMQAFWQRAGVA